MSSTLSACLLILGTSLGAILIDWLFRQRYRAGYANGCLVCAVAMCALVAFAQGHSPDHSKVNTIVCLLLVLGLVVGAWMINQNDVEDQESGQMSWIGSWWDNFDNNYLNNKCSQFLLPVVMVLLGGAILMVAIQPESPAIVSVSSPKPATKAVLKSATTKALSTTRATIAIKNHAGSIHTVAQHVHHHH